MNQILLNVWNAITNIKKLMKYFIAKFAMLVIININIIQVGLDTALQNIILF